LSLSCSHVLTHYPPSPTLFPYTTLFRSHPDQVTKAVVLDIIPTKHFYDHLTPEVAKAYSHWAFVRGRVTIHVRGHHLLRAEPRRSEEHTSELQSPYDLVCRLLLEKKKKQ